MMDIQVFKDKRISNELIERVSFMSDDKALKTVHKTKQKPCENQDKKGDR